MTRTILAVRPEPGLAATIAAGEKLGLTMIGYPLFEIRPVPWDCPDPASIDALLLGSANAIRHGGEALETLTRKPVHAVGQATAGAARDAGFTVASCGAGGLQKVLDAVSGPARLLRLSGEEHVPLSPPRGVDIETRVAYRAVALALPETLRPRADAGLVTLLHSAAAARQFARETRRLGIDRSRIRLAVIGPRVAEAVGDGWHSIHVSPEPSDAAMLEMARETCI